MEKIYKPLQILSEDEIERILLDDNIQELITLPLSVGETFPQWKVAQDLCIKLSEYPDPRVRANSILGLAYIARTKGKLEKYIVKPVIFRALREETEYKWRIIDALKDINLFMGWNIGAKKLKSIP
ncbi:hypothetical protein [Anaerospora sp.]|uniref:hypothetical protein n=1 Tax=Anaerospora sp. TaxID=1960278 RepID=UPI00289946CC|nr:hypothetical protein [Anaerospora sp.]